MPSRADGFVGRSVICHRGPAWQPAPTRKSSTCFAIKLRRQCLHISESVTAGGHGFLPVRGHFLYALPSHYVGSVYTLRNLLPRTDTAFRLYADIFETIFHIGDGHKISA